MAYVNFFVCIYLYNVVKGQNVYKKVSKYELYFYVVSCDYFCAHSKYSSY